MSLPTVLGSALIAAPAALFAYAYAGYPLLLKAVAARRPALRRHSEPNEWPTVSITVPCFNEEARLADALESLLALDYPADKLQILVISDASTDRTDAIVEGYAARGVELLRLPVRRGKSAAENAAGFLVRGDLVVNIDASVRVVPNALKALVLAFEDPTVGVASGCDVSVGAAARDGNRGEAGYVGYEMWIRALESRAHSIVGASGCFYGIRRALYVTDFPEHLSRDFGSALLVRERGYRAVSVGDATCIVPRTASLESELRRKVRTMARGLETLWYKRHLLNPRRYGMFAWSLLSHKLARWLVYLTLPGAVLGLALLSLEWPVMLLLLGALGAGALLGVIGMRWRRHRTVPVLFALPGFVLASCVAGLLAWRQVLRGQRNAMWEPTRRTA